jgi:hypothetical protein
MMLSAGSTNVFGRILGRANIAPEQDIFLALGFSLGLDKFAIVFFGRTVLIAKKFTTFTTCWTKI